ncbi:HNH endonuclease [Halomonas halmophila]|uniref:HNH nuclease domain-containing protein n=1 Tax=Halomonas halmophila TaxID=252 RepID=A0A4Y4F5C8_9GAMM|nr:HNH endonuclease signature motif containing protein [Halomonas halmophila]GED22311.1 hypothetical protein HHA01_12880 [Halomonas halmophila]
MQRPRSRRLHRKPQALEWINADSDRSALLVEAIRTLEAGYGGEFSGFVDFAPAEYRFNGEQSGGYVILSARNTGSVRAHVQLIPGDWKDFELKVSADISDLVLLISENHLTNFDFENAKSQEEFGEAVEAAVNDTSSERKERLKNANPEPKKEWRKVAVYVRNPDVVAEVLHRAKGDCEKCGERAPFVKRSDGKPYLEVHHKIQLSDGGDDTVENAVALCPNCHRKEHFG